MDNSKATKNVDILDQLLASISIRDGQVKVNELKGDGLKEATKEAIARELIFQIIAGEEIWVRVKFLALYPGLILPYLTRVRVKK